MMFSRRSAKKNARRITAAVKHASPLLIEELESRKLLSVNVLTYHDDTNSDGLNNQEVQLTPTNVKTGSFGKLFTTSFTGMGNVYAQPLVDTGVTVEGAVHNVVIVATENDLLLAIDTGTGAVLWQRSFVTLVNSGGILNNTLGASLISTVSSSDVGSSDISPNIGITGTPVIDSARNLIYLVVSTKEVINSVTTFVQRLHAINIADGTDATAPYVIGATSGTNTNTTKIYAYGNGAGSVTDPYNGTGKPVDQFNALTLNQRSALSLVNNTVYVSWASHGDNGPYHGWVVAWNVSNIATSGFALSGVLNTCPNNSEAGIWQGGGSLVFEPDGSAFYFLTGNGTGGANAPGSNGLPADANYNECLVKAELDPTTTSASPTNGNPNGWGLKIVDFFSPYNVAALDGADSDFGSGAPVLIPTPITVSNASTNYVPTSLNLIAVGGKDGRIFLLNRNNLGHYSSTGDAAAVNAVTGSSGIVDAPEADGGTLSAPAWYNGHLYVIAGYSGNAYEYSISSAGTLTTVSETSNTFGYEPGGPAISSNGTSNGIVWLMDRNLNELHAYDANSLNTEFWNSSQATGQADAPGALTKFSVPTVANGEVFIATTNSIVAYGLTPPASADPSPPVLSATALSGSAVNLTWTDPSVSPNRAAVYLIQESTNDSTFTQVATAPAGSSSLGVGGLNPSTPYYFRILGQDNIGNSAPSNVATATTTAQSTAINYPSGFAGASGNITVNGTAGLSGSNLQLTAAVNNQLGSAFYSAPVSDALFNTQFTIQISAGTNTADGMTFTLQNAGANSLGAGSGGLGYQGINDSVAIKFDLYSNNGEGADSTGLFSGGAIPENLGSVDLSSTGINLHSGDPIAVNLSYNGTTLTEVLTDTVTNATATETYTANIPSLIGSGVAYAGFTGATGGLNASENVLNWTYTPGSSTGTATTSPNAPTGLGATPATATSVTLNWTNNALNQTGYYLDRATDSGFTDNLIVETLPATPSSFTDTTTGLAPGGTYYYQISAFNSVGASGESNVASVTIPMSPLKATNQIVTGVTTNSISMSWQDNAGHLAQGYNILRATDMGMFTIVATLPPTSRAAPSTYSYTDNTVTPGNYYEYHIEAYNSSGYNDFAGVNATTVTTAPTAVTATPGTSGVALSWSAPTPAYGGVTYNIYRSTTPGGEGSTPLFTGITTASYLDSTAQSGTPYYYEITAVNPNSTYSPPLPSESAPSAEASTVAPVRLTGTASANTTLAYNNNGDTYLLAFDGNTSTFFDAPNASGNWIQLNFGSPQTITSINFAPRVGYESRMQYGVFEASNDPNFVTGVVTLDTVGAATDGLTNSVPVSVAGTYQYVRYVSPGNSYGNIAEMQVFGTPASSGTGTGTAPTITTAPAGGVAADGITAALTVGASETGNPALTYTWSTVTLPDGVSAVPTFSASNGTTTGNNTAVGFSAVGTYGFEVTITDPSGNSIVEPLSVTVNQVLTEIDITPNASPVSLAQGTTRNFATNTETDDQFGDDIDPDPTLTWAILSGGGSIDPVTGIYTASGAVGSTAIVTATAPGVSGNVIGSVSVTTTAATTPAKPVVSSGPTATVSAAGTTAALAVAASETGNPALTYTWSVASLPTGVTTAPTFSASNGTTTGNAVTVTFPATDTAGTYGLNVTITDTTGNSTVVPLAVVVSQVLTSITISPTASPVSVTAGGTQAFTASALDQFGIALATQPTFAWAIANGGTGSISATGVYTAPATVGSTATVTATSGTVVGNVSVKTTAAGTTGQLTGTYSANTTLAYNNNGDTYLLAFDGNTSTFFDAPTASGNWIQINFGSPQTITSINFAPRVGYESRMQYGVFEASNDPNFVTGVVTLDTVGTVTDGLKNSVTVTNTGTYQYVRYVSPANSYGNIAEIQVFGTGSTTTVTKPVVSSGPTATVSAAGTTAALAVAASETGNPALTYTWSVASLPTGVTTAPTFSATNGTTTGNAVTVTFPATDTAGTYGLNVTITDTTGNSTVVPLSVVVSQVLTSITISPTASPVSVTAGGTQAFTASALDQFGKVLAPQPAFVWAIANGGTGSISAAGVYTAPATVGSTATVTATSGTVVGSVSVKTSAAATNGQLTGTASANTTLAYNNNGDTYLLAFDGNTNTFFDAPSASGDWIQLNFGSPQTITSIAFAPRVGFENRMQYGVFEASNDPNFVTGVATLYTVGANVGDGLTTVPVTTTGTYQYVRYVAPPSSYGNIAEMQVFGTGGTTTTAKPVVSSGPTATVSAAGITAALAVAASETGNPALTYTWSVASLPTGVTTAPTFSSTNGTTSGTAVTVSFAAAGTYGLNITITDTSGNSTVAPLSVVVSQVLTGITISPSTSPVSVVAGGTQAFTANALDQFAKALATQPTFTWALANGGTGSINATGVYTAPATVGSTATVTATSGTVVGSVSVKTTAAGTAGQLTGTYSANTTLAYNNNGETYLNVFDGNTSTFWDAPNASGNWVQINFAAAHTITSINFAPRVGYESRMQYGVFEASNDPNFVTGVVTLDTVGAVTDGLTNSVTVTTTATFQYVRYVSPGNSYGNIAEIQVFGV